MKKTILAIFASCLSLMACADIVKSSLAASSIAKIQIDSQKYTAKDYIQDDLVAIWDGIENAGWNQHVDSTNIWTDLIGGFQMMTGQQGGIDLDFSRKCAPNGQTMAIYNGAGDIVEQQGIRYYSPAIALKRVLNSGLFTIEIVVAAYTIGLTQWQYSNYIPFGVGLVNSHASLFFRFDGKIQVYSGILASGNTFSAMPFVGNGIKTTRSLALDKNNLVVMLFANGVIDSSAQLSPNVNWNSSSTGPLVFNSTCIGNCNYGAADNKWDNVHDSSSDVYCIRIYRKVLNVDEISYNYKIDKVRFGL